MARNVKWKVNFKTINDRDAEVLIYEEGWSGEITEIEPAENAISTEEDNDEEIMKPVRTWTGYLRVIDNGDLEGLMPTDNHQHYVELLIDNVLKWCGYMQADTFSEDWDIAPLTVEFPLISPIGVLGSVYLDQTKDMGLVSLGELILECLTATNVTYEKIYFPKEVWYSIEEDIYTAFSVKISRANFFSVNNSINRESDDWQRYNADTCLSFLEEFCKFWGWTLHERGYDLYFIGRAEDYYSIHFDDLKNLASGVEGEADLISCSFKKIEDLELAGDGHKKSIIQGYGKFIVQADINKVTDVVPSINKKDMEYIQNIRTVYNDYYGRILKYEQTRLYANKDRFNLIEFKSYSVTEFDYGVPVGWYDATDELSPVERLGAIGAEFVEYDRFTPEERAKKRNYNYKDAVGIQIRTLYQYQPTPEQAQDMVILRARGQKEVYYDKGAFVISASAFGTSFSERPNENEVYENNGKGTLDFRFRVGKDYWNGNEWTEKSVWFSVAIGNDDDDSDTGTGKIKSTKTLDMPYNGADGYIMIINKMLSGEAVMEIRASSENTRHDRLYMNNLKVEYYKDDTVTVDDRDTNYYYGRVNENFPETFEWSLKIASDNNNEAAYNTLSGKNGSVGTLYFIEDDKEMFAEEYLLSNLKRLYGRITEKLTLQVERNEGFSPLIKLTNGENTYKLLSESINWAEETEEIMIENIPI